MKDEEHELLITSLNDDAALEAYKTPCDGYRPGIIPLALGKLLVFFGNTVYGRKPSYQKFKAVEVIARIPYQSWETVSYTFLTALYSNEIKAIELAKTSEFSRVAQDNETMHVVVISQIVKREGGNNFIIHTFIPLLFAFFYTVIKLRFGILFIFILLIHQSIQLFFHIFYSTCLISFWVPWHP